MVRAALILLALPLVVANFEFLYAGFDHVIKLDHDTVRASAFDLRRSLPAFTTCDLLSSPPLVADSELQDWISKDYRQRGLASGLSFTYLGYENFIMENKRTGDYIVRRCRDFRPQLDVLPCEPYSTGSSKSFSLPNKTIFLGNGRILIVNIFTGDYSVHPFDADVHTGGDPFRFNSGPFFTGKLEIPHIGNSTFAYLQLKNNEGDLLLVLDHQANQLTGWKYNGLARSVEDFHLEHVFSEHIPGFMKLTSLGENEALMYSSSGSFERWTFVNIEGSIRAQRGNFGSLKTSVSCMTDNVTACVETLGCAWCPSTYTCHPYDLPQKIFCDLHACSVNPLTDPNFASSSVVVPDCVHDPNLSYHDVFEQIHDGYEKLPGHIRLDSDYRDDVGAHTVTKVAPIHPNIDNTLGEDPVIIDEEFQDEVIHENNRVGRREVYLPPTPSESAPCMDNGYSAAKAVEIPNPESANIKMNLIVNENDKLIDIPTTSPHGDDIHAHDPGCGRNGTNAALEPNKNFLPTQGENPATVLNFNPQSVTTRFEEDLMNFDKTKFSDLKARWVDDAEPVDKTLAKRKIDPESLYKPREPEHDRPHDERITPPKPTLRVSRVGSEELMNTGLNAEGSGLIGSDCTETGGEDGVSTKTQNLAMHNSKRSEFPETLESQLSLTQNPTVVDVMDFTAVETNHQIHLPEVQNHHSA